MRQALLIMLAAVVFPLSAFAQENQAASTLPAASSFIKSPPPVAPPPHPTTRGCFRLPKTTETIAGELSKEWANVPCETESSMHAFPPPQEGGVTNGILGLTSNTVFVLVRRQLPSPRGPIVVEGFVPERAGITSGAVRVNAPTTLSGAAWTITDSQLGADSYSVQTNTNAFTSTCHNLQAPAGTTGWSCTGGDLAGVQFVYQQYSVNNAYVCLYNVDIKSQQYFRQCSKVEGKPASAWTSDQIVISGAVDPATHTLSVTAGLPWLPYWVTVTTPDWYGLCWNQASGPCSWTEVSGTILGAGNSSNATISANTAVETTVSAATCQGLTQVCNALPKPFNPILPAHFSQHLQPQAAL